MLELVCLCVFRVHACTEIKFTYPQGDLNQLLDLQVQICGCIWSVCTYLSMPKSGFRGQFGMVVIFLCLRMKTRSSFGNT
jgi:hypothetical protein